MLGKFGVNAMSSGWLGDWLANPPPVYRGNAGVKTHATAAPPTGVVGDGRDADGSAVDLQAASKTTNSDKDYFF